VEQGTIEQWTNVGAHGRAPLLFYVRPRRSIARAATNPSLKVWTKPQATAATAASTTPTATKNSTIATASPIAAPSLGGLSRLLSFRLN
jgi:hypothetical protein